MSKRLSQHKGQMIDVRKVTDGYRFHKFTWAVVVLTPYGYEVIESGFPRKRDAQAWLAASTKK